MKVIGIGEKKNTFAFYPPATNRGLHRDPKPPVAETKEQSSLQKSKQKNNSLNKIEGTCKIIKLKVWQTLPMKQLDVPSVSWVNFRSRKSWFRSPELRLFKTALKKARVDFIIDERETNNKSVEHIYIKAKGWM